jgi:hypothetical protein
MSEHDRPWDDDWDRRLTAQLAADPFPPTPADLEARVRRLRHRRRQRRAVLAAAAVGLLAIGLSLWLPFSRQPVASDPGPVVRSTPPAEKVVMSQVAAASGESPVFRPRLLEAQQTLVLAELEKMLKEVP